jgi:hypothetical protein
MNIFLKAFNNKYVLSVHALIVFTIFCSLVDEKINLKFLACRGRSNDDFYCAPMEPYRRLPGAGIFKESMGARNRGGIGLSYRPARLHRLAEFIPWNRFLGSINVLKYGLTGCAGAGPSRPGVQQAGCHDGQVQRPEVGIPG